MFYSAAKEKPVTFKEYTEAMPEEQKYIYYAVGESVKILGALPQAEPVRQKGYDILYLLDDTDEFLVKMLGEYGGKQFISVSAEDLGLETEEEKDTADKAEAESRELLDFVKESLGGKIAAAKISHKLVSRPVCLTTQGNITLEMERYFASLPESVSGGMPMKAERVLELNPGHPVFKALKAAFETDRDRAKDYAELLYGQSLLAAGLPIDDPAEFSELVCKLMV